MGNKVTAVDFVSYIAHWIGYTGKKSAESLDEFYGNITGKYTIFAQYFDDLKNETGGPLNTKKQNSDFCAIGLLYSACQLAGSVYDGFDLLCQTWKGKVDDCAAGVGFMWNYFGYYGRQFSEPKFGDIAFVQNDEKKLTHVCCVAGVNGNNVITVDFNWGSKVTTVTRDISEFRGFGRPNYAEETDDSEEVDTLKKTVTDLEAKAKEFTDATLQNQELISSLEQQVADLSDKAAKFDAIKTIVETLES